MKKKVKATILLSVIVAINSVSSYADTATNSLNISTKSTTKEKKKVKINIAEVKEIAPPERAMTTVSKVEASNLSPQTSITSILKKVPGMNVVNSGGIGNTTASGTVFTYQGFTSSQMAQSFDGVPITNPFNGGTVGGANLNRALPVLTTNQISGVNVYSGANTPSQNGVGSLGGTIDYIPKKPTGKFYGEVTSSGGKYSENGGNYSESLILNSGDMPYTGTKLIASYSYNKGTGFYRHTNSVTNAFYAMAIQPFNHGLSNFSFTVADNNEKATIPYEIPIQLINKFGQNFQFPTSISRGKVKSNALTLIAGWKTLFNSHMTGSAKTYYEEQDYDRLGYSNAADVSQQYPGFVFSNGFPVHTVLYGYDTSTSDAPTLNNTYNPVALFGSGYAGSQYHRYIDNTNTMGALGNIGFIFPHNYLKIGGSILTSYYNIRAGWYGNASVPLQIGYNTDYSQQIYRNIYSGYIEDSLSFLNDKLNFYPGVKYSIVNTRLSGQAAYEEPYGAVLGNGYSFIEPSIGLSFNPYKNLNLYFSAGETYKAPDASAYYSDLPQTIGNPIPGPIIVQPEKAMSYNFGVRYNNKHLKSSLSFFRRNFSKIFNQYENLNTGLYYQYNNGSALYQGFSFSLGIPITKTISIHTDYTYTSAKYTSLSNSNYDTTTPGEYRPNVPLYNADLGIRYKNNNLFLSLNEEFVGRQYIKSITGATTGSTLPSYQLLNFTGSYSIPMTGVIKLVKLSAYADNILDKNYLAYAVQENAPYNYYAGVAGAPVFVGASITAKF